MLNKYYKIVSNKNDWAFPLSLRLEKSQFEIIEDLSNSEKRSRTEIIRSLLWIGIETLNNAKDTKTKVLDKAIEETEKSKEEDALIED